VYLIKAGYSVMAILSKAGVTDEKLMTVFTGVEALINSRTLTVGGGDGGNVPHFYWTIIAKKIEIL